MSSPAWPDELGLAPSGTDRRIGRFPSADARARLFALHVELFVKAPSRDRETIRSFEALALGFLPRLDRASLLAAAHILAPCPDAPPDILTYLVQRAPETRELIIQLAPHLPPGIVDLLIGFGPRDAVRLASRPGRGAALQERLFQLGDALVDEAFASNLTLTLAEPVVACLASRADAWPRLGRLLLARSDLAPADEAALYCAADPARRARIRARIEASSAAYGPALPSRLGAEDADALLAHAGESDLPGFEAALARALGLPPDTAWHLLRPERQELLALALIALGLEETACIRIFLTLHPAISHSVGAVFALTETVRAVPRATANALVEAILRQPVAQGREALVARPPRATVDPAGTPPQMPALRGPLEPAAYDALQRLAG